MTPELVALLDQISLIGQELSPDSIDRLAASVKELSTAEEAARLSPPTPRERVLLKRLVQLWRGVRDIDPPAVGLALLSSKRTALDVEARQTVDLVWTGPRTTVPMRRNDQALQEVIESAERELLLVSYAVYDVPRVAEGLSATVERGASVRIVLEFEGAFEGDQSFDPRAALGVLPAAVLVYHWPVAKRKRHGSSGRLGYVHAKCAVADRHVAFVSSANLTAYAMNSNIELGVAVSGGVVPERIVQQFDQLIGSGVLELHRGS